LTDGARPRARDELRRPFPRRSHTVQRHRRSAAAADAIWDAGDLGCGDLVLQLRLRIEGLPPGAVLRLVARDPGAPADLPAWCRLTGHRLLAAEHPVYLIQRKER
jgi:tRNA 2-thiouridine synthesizing protein A